MAGLKQPIVNRSALMNSKWVRYRRCLARGNFSVEANTEAVPEPGFFFLLQDGKVLLQTVDYDLVEARYNQLCRDHWEGQLHSASSAQRVAGAWGLLGLEPAHHAAAAVIDQDGTPQDQARLLRSRSRQRFLRRTRTTT
jgi:hypothetical protein